MIMMMETIQEVNHNDINHKNIIRGKENKFIKKTSNSFNNNSSSSSSSRSRKSSVSSNYYHHNHHHHHHHHHQETILSSDEQHHQLVEEPLPISPSTTARTSPLPWASRPPSRTTSRAPSRALSRTSTNSSAPGRISTAALLAGPDTPRDDVKQLKELAQRKNLIYLGIPAIINIPSTRVKETTRGVFHIYNPTSTAISWSLTPTSSVFYKRGESMSSTLGQKVNDGIFVIMKQHGFLRSGQSERVDIIFTPLAIGVYHQEFSLGEIEAGKSQTTGENNEVVVELQIEGNGWPPLPERKETQKKEIKFEVSENEIKFPPTRMGKQKTLGITIENPTKETIRIKCKCEVTGATLLGPPILSIPSSVMILKPGSIMTLPICFHPRKLGLIKGEVTLSSPMSKSQVKVDVIAQAVSSNFKSDRLLKSPTATSIDGEDTVNNRGSKNIGNTDPFGLKENNETNLESNNSHSEISNIIIDTADINQLESNDDDDLAIVKPIEDDIERKDIMNKVGQKNIDIQFGEDNTTLDVSDVSSNGSTDTTRVDESNSQ
ncbi:hypothetical protein G9A89_016189 [Geosiphon pyriformis]|nr:hypothetical protein G9A89_016189 [Geosiphon pyriformis]